MDGNCLAEMVGYGLPGIAGNGLSEYDGIRRAGANMVGDTYWPYNEPQYVLSVFSRPIFGNNVQPLEWQSTPGDSGGGWLIDVNGQLELAAINSFAVNYGNYGFGSLSGALDITIPEYRSWILSQVPEPSSIALLTLGALLLAASRRRQ